MLLARPEPVALHSHPRILLDTEPFLVAAVRLRFEALEAEVDIIADVGRGPTLPIGHPWQELRRVATRPMGDITSVFYLRFRAVDRPGVLARIAGLLGNERISITSVIQKERKRDTTVPLVILTHASLERSLRKALREIAGLRVVRGKPVLLRIEEHLA